MITIYIDNKPSQVRPGQNLLQACLSLGFDIPYFCWHPALHSVGACRQCAVKLFKDEKDTRGRIVMSCMTPVADGMRISIDDPEAKEFRKSVIEWLMLNHPHDCPVCDEGGECHLQDMTVMTGHIHRRTRFKKRTYRNQNLGPFINHEMNRCIQCYRCIRFYRGIAGGRDLNVFSCHDHVYFGRAEDGALESGFSGNLVEICPTGVFTDKTLKQHYARKWDMQTAPSICVHCGVGCNTIAAERSGILRRILNRYNHDVNGYFLCDRGRFGYEFVNSDMRIRKPLLRDGNALKDSDKDSVLKRISEIVSKSRSIIGIGSPRASLESNFALRSFVGADNFYSGMSGREHTLVSLIIDILQKGPARTPSLRNVQTCDAVLVLGEDVMNTAPMLALSLRQSVRQKSFEIAKMMKLPLWDDAAVRNASQDRKSPLFIASPAATWLDDAAAKTYRAVPDDIAKLGFAVAHELDPNAPAGPQLPDSVRSLAKEIAQALKNAERPLVVSGTGCMSEAVIQAAANIAWALCSSGKPAELCYAVMECNSMGAQLMAGKSLEGLLNPASPPAGESMNEGRIDAVIILENDLYRRADKSTIDNFLSRTKNIIVIDHLLTPTSSKADIVLPAAAFAESSGTLVSSEGRAQRLYAVFKPNGEIQESWRWIHDIIESMESQGHGESIESKASIHPTCKTLQTLDSIDSALADTISIFKPILNIAPPADFRIAGMRIPRQPHRFSGRTAMLADKYIHEPKPPEDRDSPLAYSMEGFGGRPAAPLVNRYWSPGWNSVQALNKFQQEVGGPLSEGEMGKRLIEPAQNAGLKYFTDIPSSSDETEKNTSMLQYFIFGSDELSSYSPAIMERMAQNHEDAD